MQIRPMRMADLAVVERLEQQLFPSPHSLSQLEKAMAGRHWLWLAEEVPASTGGLNSEEGAMVSSVLPVETPVYGYLIASYGGGVADLLSIGVASGFQRRGIARQLLQSLLEQLPSQHVDELFLEVRRSNTSAIGLYHQCGLQQVGVRKGYYPAADGREDALVMRYGPTLE